MKRVRRLSDEVHVELTPMIDVVFLLLTFFLFSIVMMIRADVLDVTLPELTAGEPAESRTPITLVIDSQGDVLFESELIELGKLTELITSLQADAQAQGNTRPIVLAVDTQAPSGVLIALADQLTANQLGEFSILGRESTDTTQSEPTSTQIPANEGSGVIEEP